MEKEAAADVPKGGAAGELEAIHQVLRAEQAAEEAVRDAREEASRILLAAKAKAREIHEVSNRRLSAFHARCAQVAASRHDPAKERGAREESLTGDELKTLREAVAEVAEILTGEPPPATDREGM